jgi:hypothetical protein
MEELKLKDVTLRISWVDLLGAKREHMDDQVRRDRWEEWKKLSNETGNAEMTDVWTQPNECCATCPSSDGDWCTLEQLPCNVSPFWTFSGNGPGLACNGAGNPNSKSIDEL